MTAALWPDWLEPIWAKSPEQGSSDVGESLAQHTWNVLAKLSEQARLRPNLPATIGMPRLWHCLFWGCWLHDFGKAAQGFQDALRGGKRWVNRHEVLSLAFIDWVADAFTADELPWLAAAIGSHHRDAAELKITYSATLLLSENQLAPPIEELSDESIRGLWRWLVECSPSWVAAFSLGAPGIAMPTFPQCEDALIQLRARGADRARFWLKSYIRLAENLRVPQGRTMTIPSLALRGHVMSSDHMGSARPGELPPSSLCSVDEMLTRLGMKEATLYDHQRICASTEGSAVLVAPTGSGKTEAALLWACAQIESGLHPPRLYYVLPYQASMNAMYDRLTSGPFYGQVGLEHSRSMLALYYRLLTGDYTPAEAAKAARWSKNLAKLNFLPVRVLSPYQILKAPFRLKGYESLFSDFFDAAFVLDEVHAYEPERLGVILATMQYLSTRFRARFLVMSATLPGLLEARLRDALGEHQTVRATSELFERFRRHRLVLEEGELVATDALNCIVNEARCGKSVLVCCNLVARAQETYEHLRDQLEPEGIETVLLHGRFNGKDRLSKERRIGEATRHRHTGRKPIVLVATQAVEVSLDIDLDVGFTEPAPLEALVQRFGRVNRRQQLPEPAIVHVFMEPTDGQRIYEPDLVQNTLATLAKRDGAQIDEASITTWLDEVYVGRVAEQWNLRFEKARRNFNSLVLDRLWAFESDDALEEQFYRAFDGVEVLPASLQQEYLALAETDPLDAAMLTVPIRWGQYIGLKNAHRVRDIGRGKPRVVEGEYDAIFGLRL